ncbi:uncharacterized protein LOC119688939 [Teleopsis dalmanni]|uniref:uncharacterized protein LOC119688939 n=1 Tax=Teleopsis dalmanni TaxID=139649 RepID=UPI0018CCA8DE|nr:uncharacterized protein LOC119688939 [Teleopsis dalmanni]
MSDPLHGSLLLDRATSTHLSDLKYAKLHSPKMKSVYWRYFGFPTNENDRIITKQNVVCTLCHKVLTNHGNTTNLRAHLQHRHKELFSKICEENGIKVPQRKPPPKYPRNSQTTSMAKSETVIHRIKEECVMGNESSNNSMPGDEQLLYEAMIPMSYDDAIITNDQFMKVEVGQGSDLSTVDTDIDIVCPQTVSRNFNCIEEVDPFLLQDTLANMIVLDLRNIDSLYDPGMSTFIRQISGNLAIPAEKRIATLIREQHYNKFTTLSTELKTHSQTKEFSFGLEMWRNVEHKQFLTVYFNYISEKPVYSLLNEFYATYEISKFMHVDALFQDFNLSNCSAVIVNYEEDDPIKDYLREHNIPILLSFDVVSDKCLNHVLTLPEVLPIMEELRDIIDRYSSEICSKDVEIPMINPDFPWTFYELLKFFTEQVVWPDEMDSIVSSVKEIMESINGLLVSLDTLKGEEIPHSSMLSPITLKIINKRFTIAEKDTPLTKCLKSAIKGELEKLVIHDNHLTLSALLDPRFHRLINLTNLPHVVEILKKKLAIINECEVKDTPGVVNSFIKPFTQTGTTKKSNLELFFDISDNVPKFDSEQNIDCIERELKRYRNEVYVSLDGSPYQWWNQFGKAYGNLQKIAKIYQCVPCIINMNFKKPIYQQIADHNKRFMLTSSCLDAILFLHHHNGNI